MLQVENITKSFGGVLALKDVSFNVKREEVMAVVGPNGAGKTTLFNVISGAIPADEGRIFFKGDDITNFLPFERVKKGMGRTFQNLRLFNDMSVLENVLVGFYINYRYGFLDTILRLPLYFKEERRALKKVLEIIEFLGLGDVMHKKVKNLSYGIKKKVELGRALATGADLLLLDEPAAGLNDVETEDLACTIKLLNLNLEKTILFIEHDMNFLKLVAHRVVVLEFGRVIFNGVAQDMFRDERVIKAYLGDVVDDEDRKPDSKI